MNNIERQQQMYLIFDIMGYLSERRINSLHPEDRDFDYRMADEVEALYQLLVVDQAKFA